jgi:hypothetical protein
VKAGASVAEKNANAAENNKSVNQAHPKVDNLIPNTNTRTATVMTTAAKHRAAPATKTADPSN